MNPAERALLPAQTTPDRLAMSIIGLSRAERWSYARLDQTVRQMAGALLADGIKPGERLLIPECSKPPHLVAALAAIAAGILPVLTAPQSPDPAKGAARTIDLSTLATSGTPSLTDFAQPDPDLPTYIPLDASAQDRLMLSPNAGAVMLPALLAIWSQGGSALLPAPTVNPGQWPLLGARHGASILAAPATEFHALLKGGKLWPGLRQGFVTDAVIDPDLSRLWQAHTAPPLHRLI